MSDNPAGSLRRELEAALSSAYAEFFDVHASSVNSAAVSFLADSVEPIVEAARAERERIAKAIEAEPCDARKRPGDQNRAQSEAST